MNKHYDEETDEGFYVSDPPEGLEAAARLEGQLIETYRLERGKRPPWNMVGGSKAGQAEAMGGSVGLLLALLSGAHPSSLISARRTVRQLSADADAAAHELVLHDARTMAMMCSNATNQGICDQLQFLAKTSPLTKHSIDYLLSSGYIGDLVKFDET